MDDIHLFLAHAVRLEAEAARRFEELADAMATFGNTEDETFFRKMATYSREHLAEAQARSGFRPLPPLASDEYSWPDGTSPETAGWAGVDSLMGVSDALQLALQSEQAGRDFYAGIAATTKNPRVKSMADEFAVEEAEHVAALERLIERCAA